MYHGPNLYGGGGGGGSGGGVCVCTRAPVCLSKKGNRKEVRERKRERRNLGRSGGG